MTAVKDAFWLKKGYHAMTFFGKIITNTAEDAQRINSHYSTLKNHEMIHLRQAQACGDSWLRFYWLYLRHWLKARRLNDKLDNAGYLLNPFEMEAYEHEDDPHYPEATAQDGANGWRHYAKLSLDERLQCYLDRKNHQQQATKPASTMPSGFAAGKATAKDHRPASASTVPSGFAAGKATAKDHRPASASTVPSGFAAGKAAEKAPKRL